MNNITLLYDQPGITTVCELDVPSFQLSNHRAQNAEQLLLSALWSLSVNTLLQLWTGLTVFRSVRGFSSYPHRCICRLLSLTTAEYHIKVIACWVSFASPFDGTIFVDKSAACPVNGGYVDL